MRAGIFVTKFVDRMWHKFKSESEKKIKQITMGQTVPSAKKICAAACDHKKIPSNRFLSR